VRSPCRSQCPGGSRGRPCSSPPVRRRSGPGAAPSTRFGKTSPVALGPRVRRSKERGTPRWPMRRAVGILILKHWIRLIDQPPYPVSVRPGMVQTNLSRERGRAGGVRRAGELASGALAGRGRFAAAGGAQPGHSRLVMRRVADHLAAGRIALQEGARPGAARFEGSALKVGTRSGLAQPACDLSRDVSHTVVVAPARIVEQPSGRAGSDAGTAVRRSQPTNQPDVVSAQRCGGPRRRATTRCAALGQGFRDRSLTRFRGSWLAGREQCSGVREAGAEPVEERLVVAHPKAGA